MKISLIVPFYNESATLQRTIPLIATYMRKHFPEHEILFVDDGSTDESSAVVRAYIKENKQTSRIKLTGYTTNHGRGYAIRYGLKRVSGQFAGYIDCDLELKIQYVSDAIKLLSHSDIVIASKFTPHSVVRTTAVRRIGSKLYNGITRIMLRSGIGDHQAGLKFFRKDTIPHILKHTVEPGWLWDTEMLYVAKRRGLRIRELPITITYGYRKMRPSFVTDFVKLIFVLYMLRKRLDKKIS